MTLNFSAGYSADVELLLEVDGVCHELSHTASDSVRLRKPARLLAGPAELIVRIDGVESRQPVVLPKGLSPPEQHVHYVSRSEAIHSVSR